jgi:hypothetical protein
VRVRLAAAPAIAGVVVDDAVRLLAELVENAVVFSPPRADWLQVSYDDPVTAPRAGALPRRTPMANLNSLLRDPPATPSPGALDQRPARSPDQVRSLLTSFQNGIREARSLLEA